MDNLVEETQKTDNRGEQPLPSEVLYMFVGWLTCRDDTVILGASHNVYEALDRIEEFCKINKFKRPRKGWESNIKAPPL